MFTRIFPIIITPDMDAALGFYRDLLGATVAYEFPGPEGKTAYAGLELGPSHLGIGFDPGVARGENPRSSLWVYADDCDVAVERLRAAGVTIVDEPADQPWGERVARVLDPDGNLVAVGQAAAG